MEQFKVDNFAKSSTEAFPSFSPLTQDQCHRILCRLQDLFGLEDKLDSMTIVSELSHHQMACPDTNAESDGFNLQQTLSNLGINPEEDIFINWYRFDDIDRMKYAQLSKCFSDIWYPSADDVDIFDSSLKWILSIRHDGCVFYCTFQ